MTSPCKIVVAGGRGQMGQAIVPALNADPAFIHVGNLGCPGSTGDGLIGLAAALDVADVIIDFTTSEAATKLSEACAASGRPALVIGATGFEPDQLGRISEAARRIPIVRSGNFSLGINMLVGLVAQAARIFPRETWDIEISEAHHRRKIDAPSGTALMLGEAAAQGRGVSLAAVERRGRDGITGERLLGEIGFSVMRAGGIVGEHSVTFAAAEEVVTLSHSALDRSMFARGALSAARWIIGRAYGEYDMQDVLGLKSS
ncbi:4-hydroxy-tetrahydrodipicolinate reductase [Bradyrhizobium retamae]|uniref:4-hydroxy-tetrahydrodipicolinate reductase n=1 Tax=Bradyrhizobium retamae TaxID=1300035 RepID=A0A0R3N9X6_9BRAD|nr:4-hydroxy-tetrahydrodipicolinate reductase [Bradyrhizobium retamae]KRR29191.1 4-hydroxy-tetrahydrodipicolinate reductase [Bradyrhizobium retamae]